jgi:hypothetical protein
MIDLGFLTLAAVLAALTGGLILLCDRVKGDRR